MTSSDGDHEGGGTREFLRGPRVPFIDSDREDED